MAERGKPSEGIFDHLRLVENGWVVENGQNGQKWPFFPSFSANFATYASLLLVNLGVCDSTDGTVTLLPTKTHFCSLKLPKAAKLEQKNGQKRISEQNQLLAHSQSILRLTPNCDW